MTDNYAEALSGRAKLPGSPSKARGKGAFRQAVEMGAHSPDDKSEAVEERIKALEAMESIVEKYVEDYEAVTEDEDGREGIYQPTKEERYLILDAIDGLHAEDEFVRAWDAWRGRCSSTRDLERELAEARRDNAQLQYALEQSEAKFTQAVRRLLMSQEVENHKRDESKPVAWFRIENGMRVYYETEAWPDMTPLYLAPSATRAISPSPDTLWVVWFEDKDHGPEVFFGPGAEEGARRRYEQAKGAWSCHLLVRVPDARADSGDFK